MPLTIVRNEDAKWVFSNTLLHQSFYIEVIFIISLTQWQLIKAYKTFLNLVEYYENDLASISKCSQIKSRLHNTQGIDQLFQQLHMTPTLPFKAHNTVPQMIQDVYVNVTEGICDISIIFQESSTRPSMRMLLDMQRIILFISITQYVFSVKSAPICCKG